MREKIVAGNWKMNLSKEEALKLYSEIATLANEVEGVTLMTFSPLIYLDALKSIENDSVKVGAQNFHQQEAGAFTGEVSYAQLKSIGVNHVLVGHSERRMYFNEDDATIKAKVDAGLNAGLKVVFCCGEPLEIREKGEHVAYVVEQFEKNIFHLSEEDFSKLVIAYEPIWAIGTGKTASPKEAEEMHAAIRAAIATRYNANVADSISLLYGGSCNPTNAKELFAQPNIDGGLIGGASLKSNDFLEIAKSF